MESRSCIRCLLSTDVPGVAIDTDGLCSVCKSYDKHMNSWNQEASLKQFERTLSKIKKKNKLYDVLVPLSGGKDSAYVLYQCRKNYNLRCLAITYDNGFLTDDARKNISTACKILGVDHFYFGLNRPGSDLDRPGRDGEGNPPPPNLAHILSDEEFNGDELGRHGGHN